MSQPARPDAPADLADLARLTSPTERRALIERVARERQLPTYAEWKAWREAHPLPPDAAGEDYDHEAARAQIGNQR
jgi:hypothetical protein